jgi:hypothetical protein
MEVTRTLPHRHRSTNVETTVEVATGSLVISGLCTMNNTIVGNEVLLALLTAECHIYVCDNRRDLVW